jgi:endonuclease YncB( thermonuclease family)
MDADLHNGNLFAADLSDANLRGADLHGADLREATLARADLREANLRGAHLARTVLTDAILANAHVENADVSVADLTSACFADAELAGADFGGSKLNDAVFTRADVRGAAFETDAKPAVLTHTGLSGLRHAHKAFWPRGWKRKNQALAGQLDPATTRTPRLQPPPAAFSATVTAVLDGDTLLLGGGGTALPPPGRARLVGVDAPFRTTNAGRKATQALRQLLRTPVQVAIRPGAPRDRYGRALVYLWTPGADESVNEQILDAGVDKRRDGDETISHRVSALNAAESRAKQHGIGLWSTCPPANFNANPATAHG